MQPPSRNVVSNAIIQQSSQRSDVHTQKFHRHEPIALGLRHRHASPCEVDSAAQDSEGNGQGLGCDGDLRSAASRPRNESRKSLKSEQDQRRLRASERNSVTAFGLAISDLRRQGQHRLRASVRDCAPTFGLASSEWWRVPGSNR
jgi:hypothetical protein